MTNTERDAARYWRLRVLGCAPCESKQLENGTVLRFNNLDEFVDHDIKIRPSRGEAELYERKVAAPAQGTPEPPKVEEIFDRWSALQEVYCDEELNAPNVKSIAVSFAKHLRPYFPPASQTPQSLDFHTWLTRVHGFKVGAARNSYSVADLESAWNAGISHRPEVIGAKPLCLDCHGAGIINCSHFDNCRGKWVYVATPASTARTDNQFTVLDDGHDYLLRSLDGNTPIRLTCVKRCSPPEKFPGNHTAYPGTTSQEVRRALINRAQYVNGQIPHPANNNSIQRDRQSIYELEQRAAERHGRTLALTVEEIERIETFDTCGKCGHILPEKHSECAAPGSVPQAPCNADALNRQR